MAGAYPGYCSMKQLIVLLLPPEWDASPSRETMWGKVSCLWKQHDGRDWVSSHRPSDLNSKALTTTPPCPH